MTGHIRAYLPRSACIALCLCYVHVCHLIESMLARQYRALARAVHSGNRYIVQFIWEAVRKVIQKIFQKFIETPNAGQIVILSAFL